MSFIIRNTLKQIPSAFTRRAASLRPAFSTSTRELAAPGTPRPSNDPTPDAQSQSAQDRIDNFKEAAEKIAAKIAEDPSQITTEDAAYIKSREARVLQQAQPPKGSISSAVDQLAAKNESSMGTPSGNVGEIDPAEQSFYDRADNFMQAQMEVGSKLDEAPETVTKEDAAYARSREVRFTGHTDEDSIASQAQSLADKNEQEKSKV